MAGSGRGRSSSSQNSVRNSWWFARSEPVAFCQRSMKACISWEVLIFLFLSTDFPLVNVQGYKRLGKIPVFNRLALNCNPGDRAMLAKVVSLDMAHQAIGRNSGYRWSDKENHEERKHCIVLADPKLAKTFYEKSRYYIKRYIPNPESVIELKREYNNAIDGLCWFLTYLNRYICFGLEREKLAVINDYKEVLKKAGCVDKKILLVRRLYRNLEGKRKRLVGEYGRVFPAIWTRFANVSDVQSRIIFSGEWAELY